MKEAVRQRARELGFDDCHFTTANPPDHAAEFQNWLAQNQHGEMNYLQRNAHKRVRPQEVLPGAKSLVVLAASYAQACSELRVPLSEPSEHATRNTQHGLIARYARYKDFHDVLAERLKQLTEFVNSLGGDGTRSLWYVDTGPLLERDLAQRAGLGFV